MCKTENRPGAGTPDMGIFTFTFADRPTVRNKHGDYISDCVAPYGRYSAILTPDNKLIKEDCYKGDGIWGGHDVFELLAEWNKADIPNLVASGVYNGAWFTREVAPMAAAWAYGYDKTAETLARACQVVSGPGQMLRTIGVWLNVLPRNLRFPIKIVSTRTVSECPAYDSFPASVQTT